MNESEPVQPLSEGATETPAPHRSLEDQAADILRQAASPPETPAEMPSPEAQNVPEMAWDIGSVAERLGTEPATLYEKLSVTMPDGSVMTVGAMKDAWQSASELEKARETLVSDISTERQSLAEARQELGIVLQRLGNQIPQEALAEIARVAESERRRESDKLLQAIPQWKDEIKRAADWADIRKVARELGYTDAELRLAEQGYADHRMIKTLLRAAHIPKAEVPKAQPKVAVAPKRGKPPDGKPDTKSLRGQVRSGRMSESQAVAALLKGEGIL